MQRSMCYTWQDMPIVLVFKAMGMENEQEILQMIGNEDMIMTAMIPSFEECHQEQVFTQLQVLNPVYKLLHVYCRLSSLHAV